MATDTETNVVFALKKKRAMLAGDVEHLREQLTRRGKQLAAIDEAIKVYEPSFREHTVGPTRKGQRVHLFKHGVLTAAIYTALRASPQPLTFANINDHVNLSLGGEPETRKALPHRIRCALYHMVKQQKTVTRAGEPMHYLYSLPGNI